MPQFQQRQDTGGKACARCSAHRSVVSEEGAHLLVGCRHAPWPRHLDRVRAPQHAVSMRCRHPLLLAHQHDAQLRSQASKAVIGSSKIMNFIESRAINLVQTRVRRPQ